MKPKVAVDFYKISFKYVTKKNLVFKSGFI
jgi:hypothetical protein